MSKRKTPWLRKPFTPQEVSDVLLAFPASTKHLMPSPMDLAVARADWAFPMWERFASAVFSGRVPTDARIYLHEGIDGEQAWRHIRAILRSYEPKHENKMAAVATLAMAWFQCVERADGITLYGQRKVEERS